MDFRHLATHETAALLTERLAANVSRISGELQTVRLAIDALDQTLHSDEPAEAAAGAAHDLGERLAQAAHEATEAACEAVRREAEASLAAAAERAQHEQAQLTQALHELRESAARDLGTLRAELQDRTAALDAANAELQDRTAALDAANAKLGAVRSQAEGTTTERDVARREAAQLKKETAQLKKQVEAAAAEHGKIVGALDKAKALLKDTEAERRTLAGELDAAAQRLDAAERANEELDGVQLALHARLEAAAATVATLNREVEEAHAKAARAKRDAETAAQASVRDQARRLTQARMHQVVAALQKMGASVTLDDLLGALVEALATEFSRVALFRVNGSRLQGVHQVRLDFESDISNVVIPLTMDSLLAQAVASGHVEGFPVSELADRGGAPFGGTPAFVLAMPVVLRQAVAAVIYADDSDQPEASADAATHKRTFASLLWEFAGPHLSKLSIDAKELTELRNYATLLLDEIEYVYHADETAGRRGDELRKRLSDNLECAKRIYAQRVASEGPPAGRLLDEQLAAMLAAKADTGFGEDLLAASRPSSLPGGATTREIGHETAEAS
jgi:hypothetical protein